MAYGINWIYLIPLFLLFQTIPYSTAAGFWTLSGTVRDGGSCQLLSNVSISSQYNDNASNMSDAAGRYLLLLGAGNWTVTANKNGYGGGAYTTPYLQSGGITHDFYLLKPGETPINCSITGYPMLSGSITNVTSSIFSTTTTPQIMPNPTPNNRTSILNSFALAAIIIVIVLWVVALVHYRNKK